ncbi:ribulose-phosphate 3-epimerase [Candidatus Desantisbacteria bacterium CG1_02_38_46]|uniref:Ribulose-phosphate 3-epimerase n=3 Tax=unclassified Candidatus Desantisiibacteriota TaxID=3106372 RepID=A0A2H9PAW9_9BACT|nr:MAG: ribulose-phosphate 3-epimerase [Candidatus Desantisbacteria bacterium CG1_02_38_46]PIU51684.1 MAG: ribulose-phosphate 3-epimerase [Candidatus Desantisbacteria bacterium CG07_land_8_20_14_0_80_39_15]PIZ14965.1 MAG: ribulose-phosphate 3-epimerase [Candidatus Desantisbacteria bacterium CG_4_10_14_0_8_um_filter_39_17]
MREIKIAPSIMCMDFNHLEDEIHKLERGGAHLFHFDIMDGVFVPNFTLGPDVIKALRKKTKISFDVHLMICHPERYIETFVKAGSDIICVHAESTVHLDRLLQTIRSYKVKSAVALNPATPISVIKYVLDKLDMVLIMAVNPGFAGQKFISKTVEKVRELRSLLTMNNFNNIEIEVDGCINSHTIAMLLESGANVFVGGTAGVFIKNKNISETLRKLYFDASKSLNAILLEKGNTVSKATFQDLKKWWKNQ